MRGTGNLQDSQSRKHRLIYIVLTVTALLCGLIWSVTNVSHDCTYHISMSQRLLSGDRMFLEMWEPHQTSAFLTAALMWIYEKIFRTTTGIVLYLQVCGILIRGGIALLLYRALRRELEKPLAYGCALLFFLISPKDFALPEFANMQLWFSTLSAICLHAYLRGGKRLTLAAGAFCLCLAVLSYPSCLVLFPGAIALLARYSPDRRGGILTFSGVCAGAGIAVAGYFLLTLGPDTLLQCIKGMLALEPSHTVSATDKLAGYLQDALRILPVFLAVGAAGFVLSRLLHSLRRPAEGNGQERRQLWLLCSAGILLAGFLLNILSLQDRTAYSLIFMAVIAAGSWNLRKLTDGEKRLYLCLTTFGSLEFLATLLLSNMPLLPSVPYALPAIIAALIPIEKAFTCVEMKKWGYRCFICLVMLLAFRCVYIRTPLTGKGQMCSILSDLSVVRSGPAWGIISNEDGVCIERDSYPEWKQWIRPGDKVWIIGVPANTLGYLYEDVVVAGPSTMSTPSYSSAVLEYWRMNPDKYPDVIVAESYLGTLVYELQTNTWLLSWLEEEYRPEQVVDGTYYKYYFRKAR